MSYVRCYKKVKYEGALWDLTRSNPWRDVPELYLSLVVLRCHFHFLYLIDHLGHLGS